MDPNLFTYETDRWYGKFKELFESLLYDGKIYQDRNVPAGEDSSLCFNILHFRKLSGNDFRDIYRRIHDGMELLKNYTQETPQSENEKEQQTELQAMKDPLFTMFRHTVFLAVKVFEYGGLMTEEQRIKNDAMREQFTLGVNSLLEEAPVITQDASVQHTHRT
jgi:hypothetical protein